VKLLRCKCGGEARQKEAYRLRCNRCGHETDFCVTLGGAVREWNRWQRMQPGVESRGVFRRMVDELAWRLGF